MNVPPGESGNPPFERRLLEAVQRKIPLVREPYAQIASQLGCSEQDVLDRLAAIRGENGIIREISGIFDSAALGYHQSLVAFQVTDIDQAGATVAAHPGVSHCYQRDDQWNLWFTLAVSPTSTLGLERTIDVLAKQALAERFMILPMIKRYKLLARFGFEDSPDPEDIESPEPLNVAPLSPSPEQIAAISALQIDLPNQSDPFASLAESIDMDPGMLLVHAADLLAAGCLRRYAAAVRHRQAGAEANVMVVWKVDSAAADHAGKICAQNPAVSHCYLRPACDEWNYTLYTMIHGADRQSCQAVIDQIARDTGLNDNRQLWTLREFKKQRVQLFSNAQAAWESKISP